VITTGRARMYAKIREFRVKMAAVEHQRNLETQTDKFPNCRGTFDDCPSAEELGKANAIPRVCKICPVYSEK